jgi:hypothetical protein
MYTTGDVCVVYGTRTHMIHTVSDVQHLSSWTCKSCMYLGGSLEVVSPRVRHTTWGKTHLHSSRWCCDRLWDSPSHLTFLFLVPAYSGLRPVTPDPSSWRDACLPFLTPTSPHLHWWRPVSGCLTPPSSANSWLDICGWKLVVLVFPLIRTRQTVTTLFTLSLDVLLGSETSPPASPILDDSVTANEKVVWHPPIRLGTEDLPLKDFIVWDPWNSFEFSDIPLSCPHVVPLPSLHKSDSHISQCRGLSFNHHRSVIEITWLIIVLNN